MKQYPFKIGLFGIGLEAYWEQFEGLKTRLEGYLQMVDQQVSDMNAEVVNLGLVDTAEKAFEAGHEFRKQDVSIIFLYVTTYALSSTVLPVVQRAGVPVVVLNLAPDAAIDYRTFNALKDRTKMTGEWLAYCAACPVPEVSSVFNRAKITFRQITGMLNGDEHVWREVKEWVKAAKVVHIMAHNRLGLMGSYYSGMLDIYANLTLHCATFGGHMEILEVDELSYLRNEVTDEQISSKVQEFFSLLEVQEDCDRQELVRAAKTAVALDKMVERYSLGSMAYYHKGSGSIENEDAMSSVILGNSLLTAKGIPVAGEYEVKNAQAMKIMDTLGVGGSFTEYYAMDFKDDVVLMGHDGPGHLKIAEGKIKVRPLQVYHGKVGRGLSVEMSVKNGPVTLLSLVEKVDGTLMLLCAEAESVAGPILEIGNTNSRYKFSIGARRFVEEWNSEGPAHHCAVGVGHIASVIHKLGSLWNIQVKQIC